MSPALKIGLSALVIYGLFYGKKTMDIKLKYFSPAEFGVWFPLMDKKLLLLLDKLREKSGYVIMLSPVKGGIGREYGTGYHNVLKHGKVMAVDIFPYKKINGQKVGLNRAEARRFFDLATNIGFGGVGIYPDWNPFVGFHVDTREIVNGHVATWGAINKNGGQTYVSATQAIQYNNNKG